MRKQLVKAYHTAWMWPLVYSEDKWVIWSSRVIAFVIPLSIVALAFVTMAPLWGLTVAVCLSILLALVIVLVTVHLFSEEYSEVRSFEEHEANVRKFFNGFPEATDVPLMAAAPGVWVAYGHIDARTFAEAIRSVISSVTADKEVLDKYSEIEEQTGHLYAFFNNPEDGWEEGISLCKGTDPGSFPVTRVDTT